MRNITVQYDEQFYDDFDKLAKYLVKTEQYSTDLSLRIWQEIQQEVQMRAENIGLITYKPYYIASNNDKYYLLPLKYNSVIYMLNSGTMIVLFLFGNTQDIRSIIESRIRGWRECPMWRNCITTVVFAIIIVFRVSITNISIISRIFVRRQRWRQDWASQPTVIPGAIRLMVGKRLGTCCGVHIGINY